MSDSLHCLTRVAKCSHAKGRSSSKALTPSLQKAAALQVAGGLYGSLGFAPTRLNTADDPTREVELRESSAQSILPALTVSGMQKLHSYQFRRPIAGWLRLFLLLGVLPPGLQASAPDSYTSDGVPYLCGFCSGLSVFDLPYLCGFCSGVSVVESPYLFGFGSCLSLSFCLIAITVILLLGILLSLRCSYFSWCSP